MRLFKNNKAIIAIDFGSSEIKIVEGQLTKSSIDVHRAETLELPGGVYRDGKILDEDKLIGILEGFLKVNKFKLDSKAYGVVNSTSIITREINIPKIEKDEIASLLEFQVGEFLPINPDEYVIDYLILEELKADDKLRVLLIAMPRGIVLSHLNLMRKVGLNPVGLDFQGNAISKLLAYNNTINEEYDLKNHTIVSIDLGHSNTDVTIFINGNIEVSRATGIGSGKIYKEISQITGIPQDKVEDQIRNLENTEDMAGTYEESVSSLFKSALEDIISKVDKVVKYYDSREFGNRIHLLALQGGISNIPSVEKAFIDYFNTPAVKIEKLDRINLKDELWNYTNALGALTRKDEVKR